MTYPPTPGGWQDPAGGQPTYIDPISGQPAAVSPAPTQPYPAAPQYPAAAPYPTDQPQYQQPGQPPYPTYQYPVDQQYPQPGQPGYPGYPGYAGYPTTSVPFGQKTNGLAIASMVVSLAGVALLACYGIGGAAGLVGAILGHVAKRQIAQRNENGRGMALAGIIIGWITLALSLVVVGLIIWFVVWASNNPDYNYN